MFSGNRIPIIAFVLGLILVLVYASIFVVNEREQAIVLRFGEIQDVKTEPGLYFKAPFAFAGFDTVQIIEDRLLRLDLAQDSAFVAACLPLGIGLPRSRGGLL